MVKRTTKALPHNRGLDERLLAAFLLIVLVGLVIVYSTSFMIAESRHDSNVHFFMRQLLWMTVSLAAVTCICRVDLQRYAFYSVPFLIAVVGLLGLVFLMPPRNGAHRWIMLGSFTLQPSELLKVVFVYYLAFSMSNRDRNIANLRGLLLRYVPVIGLPLALVLLEPDLGTTIVIFVTVIGVFFLAGARIKHMMMAAVPLVSAAAVLVFGLGYKKARVLDFLAAIVDPLQGSYQSKQAALTLGAGGLLGSGLGEGRQKLFFLPFPHTDFVFAAAGEEIGLLGTFSVLGLWLYLLLRGLKIAYGQPDRFGYLLAAGMVLSLFVNMSINVGVVTCLLPVTGLPMPFMSYGGSSLLASCIAVGVLLNLSRRVVR